MYTIVSCTCIRLTLVHEWGGQNAWQQSEPDPKLNHLAGGIALKGHDKKHSNDEARAIGQQDEIILLHTGVSNPTSRHSHHSCKWDRVETLHIEQG